MKSLSWKELPSIYSAELLIKKQVLKEKAEDRSLDVSREGTYE